MQNRFIAVDIVPTGLKASIGGFVGDATPSANLLASACDALIVHPNIVNGVMYNLMAPNCLYVEGSLIDWLFLEKIGLKLSRNNKIGVIIDKHEKFGKEYVINTINSVEVNKGIRIGKVLFSNVPFGVSAYKNKAGAFVGEIERAEKIIEMAEKLLKGGCNAIAVSAHIEVKKKDLKDYFAGKAPNPYGGVEAIISHMLCEKFEIPCAHAPILFGKEIEYFIHLGIVDPRASAEAIGPAYLGSVLQGLHHAPQITKEKDKSPEKIFLDDICALITPADCLGGIPHLSAENAGIPIIAVRENKTILNVTNKKMKLKNVFEVENYLEAAGILLALREGITPSSVRRPIKSVV